MKTKTKTGKYRNRFTLDEDGQKFDSKKEMRRYLELKKMEQQGLIWNLRRQVKFTLLPSVYEERTVQLKRKTTTKKVCVFRETSYWADFVYVQDGEEVVEDVKASAKFQDPVYKLKKKMMYMIHQVKIKETY